MKSPDKEKRLKQLWEQLLELNPTNDQLLSIIFNIRPLEKAAIKRLWQQGATGEALISIMVLAPSLSAPIQKLLDVRNQRNRVIKQILEKMKSLVVETEPEETEPEETEPEET